MQPIIPGKPKGDPRPEAPVAVPLVDVGSGDGALEYYQVISSDLGLELYHPGLPDDGPADVSLDDLLEYLGYAGLGALNLEALDSALLMDPVELASAIAPASMPAHGKGDILAARYFAPKITDVSGLAPFAFGWRKLVRLRVQSGSTASGNDIAAAYILFNHFQPDAESPPFELPSVNTQVILTSAVEGGRFKKRFAAYFLDFGETRSDGRAMLDLGLTATFDMGDPAKTGVQKYFLPAACAVCHGGDEKAVRLAFVDTDHILDAATPPGAFTRPPRDVRAGGHPVLYDYRDAQNDPLHKSGFDVLRTLHEEMAEHNRLADEMTGKRAPLTRGLEKWLQLHPANLAHMLPIDRALEPAKTGDAVWSSANPGDAPLLGLLTEYCYRCHNAVEFSIYDKQAVIERGENIRRRIQLDRKRFGQRPDGRHPAMPQDRALSPEEIQAFLAALDAAGIP